MVLPVNPFFLVLALEGKVGYGYVRVCPDIQLCCKPCSTVALFPCFKWISLNGNNRTTKAQFWRSYPVYYGTSLLHFALIKAVQPKGVQSLLLEDWSHDWNMFAPIMNPIFNLNASSTSRPTWVMDFVASICIWSLCKKNKSVQSSSFAVLSITFQMIHLFPQYSAWLFCNGFIGLIPKPTPIPQWASIKDYLKYLNLNEPIIGKIDLRRVLILCV